MVLLVGALIFVRHPDTLLGSGPVDPGATGIAVNPALANAGSVLLVGGDQPVSLALKPKTIALTFDDGPSADWTPRIQAVLDEYGVPGTFFVIGSNVAQHPDVVRKLAAAGHEIGNHSYTHADLELLDGWQLDAQLRLTDRLVEGITSVRPRVFRPPYSGGARYFAPQEYDAAKHALGDEGRLLVLSDRLPRDFDDELTVDEVVAGAMPAGGESAVITLHDAGGDRSKTVEALRVLIPRLQAEGYTFVRASEIVDAEIAPAVRATTHERALGVGLLGATSVVRIAFRLLWVAALAGIVLGLLRIAMLLWFSHRWTQTFRAVPDRAAPYLEPVTVIIPAYNEEVGIAAAVLSIANSDYPDVRIIVVDDGSSDRTSEIVTLLRMPNVQLIRQENAGKPAALNRGIAAATTELVVLVDGDTIFDPNTVRDVVQPFRDKAVGAVAGNPKVGNRKKIITRMQHVEYTIASEIERRMYSIFGVSPCVPGAIGAFRRAALVDIGGLSRDTLAEDSDLTVELARRGWIVEYVPTARAWTEAPSTWKGLLRQRRRWSYGVLQVIAKHRRALLEKGPGGRLARLVFPYQLCTSYALAVFAPAIDLLLLHDLVFEPESRPATLAVWAALNLVNSGVSLYAMRLDGERFRSVWWVAFAQQLVYRQVLYIAALRSIAAAVVGVRLPWQTPRRVGGVVSETAPAVTAAATPAIAPTVVPPMTAVPAIRVRPRLDLVERPTALDTIIVPARTVATWPLRVYDDVTAADAHQPGWTNLISLRELVDILRCGASDEVTAALAGTDLSRIEHRLQLPFDGIAPRSTSVSDAIGTAAHRSTIREILLLTNGGSAPLAPFGLGPRVEGAPVVLAMPAPHAAPAPSPTSWGDLSLCLATTHQGLHLPEPLDLAIDALAADAER